MKNQIAQAPKTTNPVGRPLTDGVAATAARTRVVHNSPKALFSEAAQAGTAPDPNRILYLGGLSRVRGIPLDPSAAGTIPRTWCTAIPPSSNPTAEPAM